MKKWLCIGLSCLLTLCLTACGGASDSAVPTESPDLLEMSRGVRVLFADDGASETESAEAYGGAESDNIGESPEAYGDDETPDAPEVTDAPELSQTPDAPEAVENPDAPEVAEAGSYTTAQDVALYLRLYGHLPGNFITKKEAQALGWNGGSLEPYAPGKCIGGDRFGNYEGLLPSGHSYRECDIDTLGANSRGAKRLVFSDDGLIYYTEDHYNTFTLLYGEA